MKLGGLKIWVHRRAAHRPIIPGDHWSAAQWRLGDGSFGRTCRSNCSMFMPLDKIEKKRIEWQAIVPHRLAALA